MFSLKIKSLARWFFYVFLYLPATAVPHSVSRSYVLYPGHKLADPRVNPGEPWVTASPPKTHDANLRKKISMIF